MAAFMPGASPPLVMMAMRLMGIVVSCLDTEAYFKTLSGYPRIGAGAKREGVLTG
jgi:hypothetical protein